VQPRYWPDDADVYGLIFLPRFIDKIGSRVFADWTGTEVSLSEVDLLPELTEANIGDRIIASSLLKEHRPDLGQQDFISSPWSAADNARRHELWRIAQQLAERERNAPSRCGLRCIKAEIRRQSCAGELTLKIRRVSGGPFEAFQPVWWNRDNPNELFDCYIIDPEYPFGEPPSWKPNTDSWIFAPCEGIDQIAARLTAHTEAELQLPQSMIKLDPVVQASAYAQSAPEQRETPPPAPAAETAPAALKPIEPAATEPASVEPLPAPETAPRLDETTADAEPPQEYPTNPATPTGRPEPSQSLQAQRQPQQPPPAAQLDESAIAVERESQSPAPASQGSTSVPSSDQPSESPAPSSDQSSESPVPSETPEAWLARMQVEFLKQPRKRKSAWVRGIAFPQMQRELDSAPWDTWQSLKRAMYPGRKKFLS